MTDQTLSKSNIRPDLHPLKIMNPYLKVLSQRTRALLDTIKRSLDSTSSNCPSCGAVPRPEKLDRRYGVMVLRRCSACDLLFRTPTDTQAQSTNFYQSDYTEETVTELPDSQSLQQMIASGFSAKGDLSPYVNLIKRFYGDEPVKLVDYGCSWGYNTWKFNQAGFAASGVEVSRPRCDFGRENLNIDARYSADELDSDFDVFFSSHVFEHVPSPRDSFLEAKRLMGDKGGLLVVITPNGCDAFRKARPSRWSELWGRKHPNFLDEKFWEKLIGTSPHAIMSRSEDGTVVAPLRELSLESLQAKRDYDLSGEELIVVAQFQRRES